DHLLAHLRLVAGHGVRDFLVDRLRHHTGDRVRHLLVLGVRDLPAHRVRHLLVDALLDHGRARDGLADRVGLPDFAAADLVGALLDAADPAARLLVRLAGARVEAALAALADPVRLLPARHAVLLRHPLAALPRHRLAGRDRLADRADAI